MAELGQTLDPAELVPGSPDAISQDLRALVDTIERVANVGDELGSVDVLEWVGDAASAFFEVFGAEPPRWLRAVEELGLGGEALAGYADVLIWAQGQAQQAIEIYTQAMAASRAAAAQYAEQVQTAAQAGIVGPFFDPAADLFRQAQTVLTNARERLAEAGGAVAQAFGFAPDGEGGYTRDVGQERTFGVDRHGRRGWQRSRAGRSLQREFGDQRGLGDKLNQLIGGTLKQLGIEIPSGEWKAGAEAKVWGDEVSGEFDDGFFSGKGVLSGDLLGAAANVGATWGQDGVTVGASAEAYLAKLAAAGELNFGEHAGVSGEGEAFVGARAEMEQNLGWTGLEHSAEAFAGARVEGSVGAEVAGIGAGLNGEAWAGAGIETSAQVGMGDDGKFHLGGSFGIGLGVGGKVGFEVSVDPGAVVDTAAEIAGNIGEGISDAAEAVDDAVDRGVENLGNAARELLSW
jgi:hypothetical protein